MTIMGLKSGGAKPFKFHFVYFKRRRLYYSSKSLRGVKRRSNLLSFLILLLIVLFVLTRRNIFHPFLISEIPVNGLFNAFFKLQ